MGSWKFGPYWKVSERTLSTSLLKIKCILNESGVLPEALVRVASSDFTSVSVSNTQCVQAGMPTHCEPKGFCCVCKVFCPQGSITISLWEVTILSHSHSPAPKCQANIFLIILSWNVWFWKLIFGLLTWMIFKKFNEFGLGLVEKLWSFWNDPTHTSDGLNYVSVHCRILSIGGYKSKY